MKPRVLFSVLALIGGIVTVLAAPSLLSSPGQLIKGHQQLENDCFACHTPFLGPGDGKCVGCHKLEEIGKKRPGKTAFHGQLTEQQCSGCHTEHTGLADGNATRAFEHSLIKADVRAACTECHAPPKDTLHQDMKEGCPSCHGTGAWKPASLDHTRFFRFDRAHPSDCATCHPKSDFKQYTCYSCHEHSPGNIRGEHWEEGIRDFENCVQCHRSGDEEEAEHMWKSRRWGGSQTPMRRWEGEYEEHEHGEREHDD